MTKRMQRNEEGDWIDFSPNYVSSTKDVGQRRVLRCSRCGGTFLSEYNLTGVWRGHDVFYEYRTCQDCRSTEEYDPMDVVDQLAGMEDTYEQEEDDGCES